MRALRNPFLARMSEQTGADADFLRLFAPSAIEVLPQDGLWDRVHVFRSAPGGGKTSLFRLFSASSLAALYEGRNNEEYEELYRRLQTIAVMGLSGPRVLGVLLSCAQNYALLDDLDLPETKRDGLFYALLSARYAIGTLRGVTQLRRLEWPNDLGRVRIEAPEDSEMKSSAPIPGDGAKLLEWAKRLEIEACRVIDGYDTAFDKFAPTELTLSLLRALRASLIQVDKIPVAEVSLLMLDDSHKLSFRQRKVLRDRLIEVRPPIGVWLAERLEALAPAELFGIGATPGREISFVNLEDHWRQFSSSRRFEAAVTSVADRRAHAARDAVVGSFAGRLKDSLDASTYEARIRSATSGVASALSRMAQVAPRYDDWIRTVASRGLSGYDALVEWRTLQILIERDKKKGQQTLEVGLLSTVETGSPKENSALRAAAELFATREGQLPLYFGMSKLAALSSSNIEQFLEFAGSLFEEIISGEILGRSDPLTPERQEAILTKVAIERWRNAPRRVSNGTELQAFLERLGEFCVSETYRPTASYAPGVTGFGLNTKDRDALLNATEGRNPQTARLLRTLTVAVSQNLLEPVDDVMQGEKGSLKTVFYLNRWLCLKFRLPVQYGGWRLKSLGELIEWLPAAPAAKAVGK